MSPASTAEPLRAADNTGMQSRSSGHCEVSAVETGLGSWKGRNEAVRRMSAARAEYGDVDDG